MKHGGYNPKIVTAYFLDCGLPAPVYEYQFCPGRKWRFDLAWPEHRVAVEVQGGIWTSGRHARGRGIAGDMEKFNTATRMGWSILLVQPVDLCTNLTVGMILETIQNKQDSHDPSTVNPATPRYLHPGNRP